ncbi:MAG TPA: GTP 3',8-cyclase MoaA [Geomonas sp.]|nr:GTP 3',8-cyclase MoaA [Geomonas sp.]
MALIDSFGRRINYLRLSVTDRCNLRCRYCMPAEGVPLIPHDQLLSYGELLRISREAVAVGIEKIRVSGGEPLVRKGIVPFLARLAQVKGLRELVLTTNGILLEEMAQELCEAGVHRLNISLDSLKPERYAAITRGGVLAQALTGIEAAERAGFPAPKINVVLMRGVNDDEILDFVELTRRRPFSVRFIEYMPTCNGSDWRELSVPGDSVLERVARHYPVEELGRGERSGPAKNFRIPGAAGSFGIITAMTGHFCDSCNRLRVTSTGLAKGCLFAEGGVELRPVLALGDDALLRGELKRIVQAKPVGHSLTEPKHTGRQFAMSGIGG